MHQRGGVVAWRQEAQNPQRRPRPGAGRQGNVEPHVGQIAGMHVDPVKVGARLIPAPHLESVVVIVHHHTVVGEAVVQRDRARMQERRMHQVHQILEREQPVGAPLDGLGEGRVARFGELGGQAERRRLALADPGPQVAGPLGDRVAHADAGTRRQRAGAALGRHRGALAVAVETPVVIGAAQLPAHHVAHRQPSAPVRAQVRHQPDRAVAVAPRHQVLAEQPSGHRLSVHEVGNPQQVPAVAQPETGVALGQFGCRWPDRHLPRRAPGTDARILGDAASSQSNQRLGLASNCPKRWRSS